MSKLSIPAGLSLTVSVQNRVSPQHHLITGAFTYIDGGHRRHFSILGHYDDTYEYNGLAVELSGFVDDDGKTHRPIYYVAPIHQRPWEVDLGRARRMVKTLETIARLHLQANEREGYAKSYGIRFLRLARHLGATTMTFAPRSGSPSLSDYDVVDLATGADRVDQLVYEWEHAAEIAAAKAERDADNYLKAMIALDPLNDAIFS